MCFFCGLCGCCPWARRSHTLPLCVSGPSACFLGFCAFLLWVLWVLSLGEKVPHIAFACVWAKCVFLRVLHVSVVGSVGVALGREGPTHCLCVCLGQVRVFEGSVCSFVGSVGVALGRERPTHCLCVCLGQVRVFEGSVCSLWVLWVLPLGEKVPRIACVCVWAK